jgi:acid phosphatase
MPSVDSGLRSFSILLASVAVLIGANCSSAAAWPQGLPVYDHIVIVIEENKNYEQIIGTPTAPFINQLAAEGALLTQMYGEEHNSEGNYFWLFGGSDYDIGFDDKMPPHDLHASNLGQQLRVSKRSFKGYSQDLPAIGSRIEVSPKAPCGDNCGYARKHVPWVSFPDLCKEPTAETCANLTFTEFETVKGDYSKLPTVSIVIPNLINDMHTVSSLDPLSHSMQIAREVAQGDLWLRENLGGYYEWAKTHNSLLIVTFDENDDTSHFKGLTDPKSQDASVKNRIATVFAGDHIKHGSYEEGNGVTHVNILRTIEAMYGLARSGAQQPNALRAGISDDYLVTDVFTPQ